MTQPTERTNLRLAVIAIISGVFVASLSDAFIKYVSAEFQLWQIFILRSLITIPCLILIIKVREPTMTLLPIQFGWTALRSLLLVFMWVALYVALPKVELSIAGAIYYTLPLFITLFASLFIGEEIGFKGWVAVAIGFVGVLLILKPQTEDFNSYALLPLASAIFYSLAMIMTRTKIRSESVLVLSLNLNAAFAIVGITATLLLAMTDMSNAEISANTFLFGEWAYMGLREWIFIAILAALITIGSQFATIAYQNGPASIVSSFDYFYLAFIVMWGLIFFAELPDAVTVSGIILIACAGIMTVRKSSGKLGRLRNMSKEKS